MIKSSLSAFVLTNLLFVSSLVAQDQHKFDETPGCGLPEVKFDVKTEKGQHSAKSDAGKALVYFIEDDSNFAQLPRPTTRVGVDGTWVGANHGNSYFQINIDPGVHHICASWQSSIPWNRGKPFAAHFTAVPGAVYYFEIRNYAGESGYRLDFVPIDSDEGRLLANRFSYSNFSQKK